MAAPQIGYNKRVVIFNCYSLKGKGRYILLRYFWLKVKYQDLEGKNHQQVIVGPKAYTMQQEIDHLNGILISDRGKRIL